MQLSQVLLLLNKQEILLSSFPITERKVKTRGALTAIRESNSIKISKTE